MKITEKDREAAREWLDYLATVDRAEYAEGAYESLADLLATARADGRREGLEDAARYVETWGDDDKCIQPMFPPLAAAIRRLGEGG